MAFGWRLVYVRTRCVCVSVFRCVSVCVSIGHYAGCRIAAAAGHDGRPYSPAHPEEELPSYISGGGADFQAFGVAVVWGEELCAGIVSWVFVLVLPWLVGR